MTVTTIITAVKVEVDREGYRTEEEEAEPVFMGLTVRKVRLNLGSCVLL